MADGDIYLRLLFDEGQPPLGTVGAALYDAHRQLAWADDENGWALLHLCEAIGRMWQSLDDIVRDGEDAVGWSALVDVDAAPGAADEIDALPWLGQLVGVSGIEHLGDEDRRETIRRRDGIRRGTIDSIVSHIERFLIGDTGIVVRERYDSGVGAGVDSPYRGQIRVVAGQLRAGVSHSDLQQEILRRVPAGLVYEVLITDERSWDQVADRWTTWTAVETGASTWNDVNII